MPRRHRSTAPRPISYRGAGDDGEALEVDVAGRKFSNGQRSGHARDVETIRLINNVLDYDPVDARYLRKLAAVRGLVNQHVRRRVWPRLLGLDLVKTAHYHVDWEGTDPPTHRDVGVVKVDVERSLGSFSQGMAVEERDEWRRKLERLINLVVSRNAPTLHYYQGFHDVASVVLLVMGSESAAYPLLERMALHHFRYPPSDLLALLPVLMSLLDPELQRHISAAGVEPHYGITWLLTWFAHDVDCLDVAARLFDLFLSSHPLMPLYVGAISIHNARERILATECDMPFVYVSLHKCPLLGPNMTILELVRQSLALFRRFPPSLLERKAGLRPPRFLLPFLLLTGGGAKSPVQVFPFEWMYETQRPDRVLMRQVAQRRPPKRLMGPEDTNPGGNADGSKQIVTGGNHDWALVPHQSDNRAPDQPHASKSSRGGTPSPSSSPSLGARWAKNKQRVLLWNGNAVVICRALIPWPGRGLAYLAGALVAAVGSGLLAHEVLLRDETGMGGLWAALRV
eukprot:jgi/Mesvir1/4941/Mv04566-RA.1